MVLSLVPYRASLEMAAPMATALRDGQEVEIPARDLVPGDVVLLSAGDRVPFYPGGLDPLMRASVLLHTVRCQYLNERRSGRTRRGTYPKITGDGGGDIIGTHDSFDKL
jgi:hypothetical protein